MLYALERFFFYTHKVIGSLEHWGKMKAKASFRYTKHIYNPFVFDVAT